MAFRRNFVRKQFSDYLGEERAILDIFVSNEEVILPSPTPTPTSTVTPTPTPTITLTPSVTPTNTPTTTITPTPSITPTISVTPSITPTITPTNTITPTPTITPSPSPFPTYSFSGAVYDASSYSGACSSSTVVNNLWGLNPVWSGNTALFTDSIATIPAPAGFYNYNGIALEVITGGNVPNPPYVCPPSFDADAAAYLDDVLSAGGTLNATISAATDTLFTSLKSNNLYDKLNVFYPMLGATSGSTALMGKRVSGTTYDITWTNPQNITFDYSGATGDGSTAYGDTNFNGFNEISTAAGAPSHLSIYLGTETNGTYTEIGTRTPTSSWLIAADYNGTYYGWSYYKNNYECVYSNTDARGFYIQTKQGLSLMKAFKNGIVKDTRTSTDDRTLPNSNVKVLGNGVGYSNRRIQFVSIGQGLDDTESQTLSTIINTFQTTLGRNTY